MIAGMMGMHAQFTISDETMELAAANKPDESDTIFMLPKESKIYITA